MVLFDPWYLIDPGRSELSFYTVPEYMAWKESHNNGKGWNAKYYKVFKQILYCIKGR